MASNLKKSPVLQPAFKDNDKGGDSNARKNDKAKAKADDIVDSWENELLSSDDDESDDVSTVGKRSPASTAPTTSPSKTSTGSGANTPSDTARSPHHGTRAPPPTPLARSLGSSGGWSTPDRSLSGMNFGSSCFNSPSSANSSPGTPQKRPEKQTAVANRIIAGALGVRAQRTEEQKAYDRTVRENERKRIAREREEEANRKLEAERAKNAIWEE